MKYVTDKDRQVVVEMCLEFSKEPSYFGSRGAEGDPRRPLY